MSDLVSLGMTYRGIYRDGYVRLEGDVDLRNGTPVEVFSLRETRARRVSSKARRAKASRVSRKSEWERAMARAKKMTKKERMAAVMAAAGAWKDRPEWKGKSSAEIATELRKRAVGEIYS